MTRLTAVRVVALGALCFALTAMLATWRSTPWWAALAVAAAVAASELAVVHVAFARQRWTFTVTEGVVAGAMLAHLGGYVIPGVLAGVLVAQRVRRMPGVKLQYNVAQITASAAAGVWAATALGGGVAAIAAAMIGYWLVNQLLSAVPMALIARVPVVELAGDAVSLHAMHAAASVSLGMLAAWLGGHQPLGLFGLVAPIGLVLLSYDEQAARAAEARLFAELARGHEEAGERSVDLSAQVVVTAAARLFGGADVDLVLLGGDGPMLYAGDEGGVRRRRVAPEALDAPWVLRALGSPGVRTGVDDERPYCVGALGGSDGPLAVLIARRGRGGASFGRREVMLAEVLVAQAEQWLSVAALTRSRDAARAQAEAAERAARSLGDAGAQAVPALAVLRESAVRLARLAADPAGPDPIGEIVEELHAVEQAVASLLGAIVLAAEPDLALVDAPGTAPEAPEGWTSTGVLDRPVASG